MDNISLPTILVPIPLAVIGIVARLRMLKPSIDGWYVLIANLVVTAFLVFAVLAVSNAWSGFKMYSAYVVLGFCSALGATELTTKLASKINEHIGH